VQARNGFSMLSMACHAMLSSVSTALACTVHGWDWIAALTTCEPYGLLDSNGISTSKA